MKCPFRINEVHDVREFDVTKVNMEFGECYKEECPYCLKVKSVDENNCYICRR